MEKQDKSELDKLAAELDPQQMNELLIYLLPRIIERQQTIQAVLDSGDLDAASRHAHKTLGSARTYGSARLESLLQQVRALPQTGEHTQRVAALRQALADEFTVVIRALETRLSSSAQ